jgi:hypothetical protein
MYTVLITQTFLSIFTYINDVSEIDSLSAAGRWKNARTASPEIEISSVDWAQLSRLLPEDGDRIQFPKACVLNKKDRMISKSTIIVQRIRFAVLAHT